MTTPKAGGWIAGTAVAALVIIVAAWFLAISPTLTTASETRTQVDTQLSQNSEAQVKIANLKTQFAKLDATKAELAALQLQIPTSADLAVYTQQLAAIAAAHSVTVIAITVSPAAPVIPFAPVAAPAATAPAVTASGSATADPAAPAPVAHIDIAGFYSLPTTVDVIGTYPNVLAFLQDLQTGTERLFAVSNLAGTSLTKADANSGTPAIAAGDLEIVVTGALYVFVDTAAKTAAPVVPATPLTLPVPNPATNPFKPLA